MTFLRMESVILLSMLKIVISIVSVIIENYSCATALKSDQLDTLDWGKKRLDDFNNSKNNIHFFKWSKSPFAIEVKMNGSNLDEKLSLKILGVSFSSILD